MGRQRKCERKSESHEKSLKLHELKVKKLKACQARIKNSNIENLNVVNVNGEPVNKCTGPLSSNSVSAFNQIQYGPSGPIKPVNPGNFNQAAWDKAWEEINCQAYAPNQYPTFTGSFSLAGDVLTVTSIVAGTGLLGQGSHVNLLPSKTELGIIVAQLTGVTGGVGTYSFTPATVLPAGEQDLQSFNEGGIQARLLCGRLQLKLIEDFFGCVECPPPFLSNCYPSCPEGTPTFNGTFNVSGSELTVNSVVPGTGSLTEGTPVVILAPRRNIGTLGPQISGTAGGVGVYNFSPETLTIPVGPNDLQSLNQVCECPDGTGDCPPVPLNIWGVKAFSPRIVSTCGETGSTQTNIRFLSSVSYNLSVKNLTSDLATRVAYALLLVSFVDESVVQTRILDIQSRQFGPTIDTLIGENYTGNFPLDTKFVQSLVDLMPSLTDTPVIDLVIYAEDGLEIVTNPSFPTCA